MIRLIGPGGHSAGRDRPAQLAQGPLEVPEALHRSSLPGRTGRMQVFLRVAETDRFPEAARQHSQSAPPPPRPSHCSKPRSGAPARPGHTGNAARRRSPDQSCAEAASLSSVAAFPSDPWAASVSTTPGPVGASAMSSDPVTCVGSSSTCAPVPPCANDQVS